MPRCLRDAFLLVPNFFKKSIRIKSSALLPLSPGLKAQGTKRMKGAGRRASGEATYILQAILYLSIYRWVLLRLTSVWTEKTHQLSTMIFT